MQNSHSFKCQVTFDWVEGEGCCSYTFASSTLPRVFLWNNPELLFLLCKLAKVRNFKALYYGSDAILRKNQKYTHCNKWDQNERFSGCQNVQRFLEDYRTFIAAILVNSVGIGAINLTALVTPPSKTGFHQTIEESPRQIQIQLNQCSTTLLAKNGNH